MLFAINSAPKYSKIEKISPNVAKNFKAILNILCAPVLSPIANLSETSFDITLGIPIDESVKSKAYI